MRNNFMLGAGLAVVILFFGLVFIYVLKFLPSNLSWSGFIVYLRTDSGFRSSILTLALLGNIPFLYFCQRRRLMRAAYGVCATLLLVGIVVVLSKFGIL
jgi:flagellin-like protein